MENQTGKKIPVSRTDDGRKYTSNEFMEYCSAEGIKKEHTVLKLRGITPPLNKSLSIHALGGIAGWKFYCEDYEIK